MKAARMILVILVNIAALWAVAAPAYADSYFLNGEGGFNRSISLVGGDYEVFLVAKIPAGRNHCFFGAMLQQALPASQKISLGSGVEVTDNVFPWKIDRVMSLPAGQYTFWVASESDCLWTFTIVRQSGQNSGGAANAVQPEQRRTREEDAKLWAEVSGSLMKKITNGLVTCCIHEVVILRVVASGQYPSSEVSLKDHVRFYSSYANLSTLKPLGYWILKRDGEIVNAGGLQTGFSPDKKQMIFYADMQWDHDDSRYLGKLTVEFVTTRGNSAAAVFTLTQ